MNVRINGVPNHISCFKGVFFERGASPARAISMQNTGFSEVTFYETFCLLRIVNIIVFIVLYMCTRVRA